MACNRLIFVHGWGMSARFWRPLIDALPEYSTHCLDLGFVGHDCLNVDTPDGVYITHSLGTMWALKNAESKMKSLIAVNGFSCFKSFVDARILKVMIHNLTRAPDKQVYEFCRMYDLPTPMDDLNVETLKEGLVWLRDWDCLAALHALNAPVLSLIGKEDRLLPYAQMQAHWDGFKQGVCDQGRHDLPYSNAVFCADHIRGFVDAL